jgi:NAD-dependent SIR2 family protein deacetylase
MSRMDEFPLPIVGQTRRECIQCHKEFAIEKFPPRHDGMRCMTCVYCQANTKRGVYTWGDVKMTEDLSGGSVEAIKQRLKAKARAAHGAL